MYKRFFSILGRLKVDTNTELSSAMKENKTSGFDITHAPLILSFKGVPTSARNIEIRKPGREILEYTPKPVISPENSSILRVAIIGAPNAGKSSLLNRLVGKKLSITSSEYHTTKSNIISFVSSGEKQIVFVDTPGLIQFKDEDSSPVRRLAITSWEALKDVDTVIACIDATREEQGRDLYSWMLRKLSPMNIPTIICLTKIDGLKRKINVGEMIKAYKRIAPKAMTCVSSARTGEGISEVINILWSRTKPGEWVSNPEDEVALSLDERLRNVFTEKLLRFASSKNIPYWLPRRIRLKTIGWTPIPSKNGEAVRVDLDVKCDSEEVYDMLKSSGGIKYAAGRTMSEFKMLVGINIHLFLHLNV